MDNSIDHGSNFPNIEGYQIKAVLSRTKSTTIFKATSERNEADVQITLATGEVYRTSLKIYLDATFPGITKALKMVEHPNVIPLLDSGYAQEMLFTVTPFYSFGSLKQFAGTSRSWRDVLSILLPVAEGLAYSHDHGLIHRNVKPQNIVINNHGDLCLTNFSLLEPALANKLSITLTGSGECSPAYIAPEIWQGKCSPAVDQYSFGVMLYELLTGTLPFDASNIVSLLVQQSAESVLAPSTLVNDVPEALDALIGKVLASDPSARFANMWDVRNVMQEILSGSGYLKNETQSGKPPSTPKNSTPLKTPDNNPSLHSRPVHPERQKSQDTVYNHKKDKTPPEAQQPKKKSNALILGLLAVLATMILIVVIFLIGLLTDNGIISEPADKLSILTTSRSTSFQPDEVNVQIPNYSVMVTGVGGATKTQYYETMSRGYLPILSEPLTGETNVGVTDTVVSLPVLVGTSEKIGVKLQLLREELSSGKLHVYKSSEVKLGVPEAACIHISIGGVFVETEGQPICFTTSLLPQEEIWASGGQMLVVVSQSDVEVWCLKGNCEFRRNGDLIYTLLELTHTSFTNSSGYGIRKANTKITVVLVDELKRFNLECDSCMDVQALYSP